MLNMWTKNLLRTLAALLLFISTPASALPLLDIEGAVGGWQASPSGGMAYQGDDLDLKDDLNYDDETWLMARLKIGMPLVFPNIYLMATPLEFKESTTRSQEFTFGGKPFENETNFSSRLILDHYDIGFFYKLPLLKTISLQRFNLEAGFNARIIDARAAIEQDYEGERIYAKKSETIPVPMIYLGAGVYPGERFGLEVELRGISYNDCELLSLIGRLKAKAFGPMFISGGYRYDAYDIKEDDLDIDLDFSGPFLETGLDF